jgi:capsular exopolysaccharide synthesis family protein
MAPWAGADAHPYTGEDDGGMSFRRILAALFRFRWLLALSLVLGGAAGYVAWRVQDPIYVTNMTLFVEVPDRNQARTGPITQGQLLTENYAWLDLLRSYTVLDHVAIEQKLFLTRSLRVDSRVFSGFQLAEQFRPGSYRLVVDEAGERYRLTTGEGVEVESGAVGDSVGVRVGFQWQPAAEYLPPEMRIEFSVSVPRDAARQLREDLQTQLIRGGNFLTLELRGTDPEHIAEVLNAVARRYVEVAANLKRDKLDQLSQILEEQLITAQTNLSQAEAELEGFRVQTATLPSDRAAPVPAGLQMTESPVFSDYFDRKIELEDLRRDRERLQSVLAATSNDESLQVEALEAIPAVAQSSQMSQALTELTLKRAELRALLYRYSDEYEPVRERSREIQTLEDVTIPSLAQGLVEEMSTQERRAQAVIDQASAELRNIPARSIEEARLERRVRIAENLFANLQGRYEEARLAALSSVPDVSILDRATVPQFPAADERLRLALVFFAGVLGLALLGAIAYDRVDPKVRYPEQVTGELGLAILGAVPEITSRRGRRGALNTEQVLEAFRELRLNILHAYGTGPILVTVSSPGSGEGKSLVSANLAVAFAELGHKTLLVDGDTRRGDVHHLLDAGRSPGLVNFLAGETTEKEIVQETRYANLHFVGSGSRLSNSPELLASNAMRDYFAHVRPHYSVIIVDSPPLGAGGDAFILGTLTGNMVMVLRTGTTNRELMASKLAPLSRLPIRVLGAVLNDIQARGAYRYYYQYYSHYLPGYGPGHDEDDTAEGRRAITSGERDQQEEEAPASSAAG